MTDLNVALAILGGLVLALSLGTGVLHSRGFLPSETLLALGVGVAVGPVGLDLLGPAGWGPPLVVLEQVARLTVALAVASVALRLPEAYVRRRAAALAVLLGPGLVGMWLVSSLLVAWIAGVPLPTALLVGAIVAPTDPVLASTIVVGETAEANIPDRLRYLLSGEAGANDGGAYLFVLFAVFVLGHAGTDGLLAWTVETVGWEVLGAVGLGLAVGGGVGRAERWLSRRAFLEETSVFTLTVALTFAVLGAVKLVGANDVLAVFVAGLAYNWQSDPRDETQEQKIEEVFSRVFTLPVFVLFGTMLPVTAWLGLGWRGLALVVAVLLFRRLPVIAAVAPGVRPLDRPQATLFVGWFGPIGVAALYYATLAVREAGSELPWVLASLIVTGSIVAHGGTATLLTIRYGRLGDDETGW